MTDRELLDALKLAAERHAFPNSPRGRLLVTAVNRLAALLASADDARRYRWLRQCTGGEWERMQDVRMSEGMVPLDAAIDARSADAQPPEALTVLGMVEAPAARWTGRPIPELITCLERSGRQYGMSIELEAASALRALMSADAP